MVVIVGTPEGTPDDHVGTHPLWYLDKGPLLLEGASGTTSLDLPDIVTMGEGKLVCPKCKPGHYADAEPKAVDAAYLDLSFGQVSTDRFCTFGFAAVPEIGGPTIIAPKPFATMIKLKAALAGGDVIVHSGKKDPIRIRADGNVVRIQVKNTYELHADEETSPGPMRMNKSPKSPGAKLVQIKDVEYVIDRHFELLYELDPTVHHLRYWVPLVPKPAGPGPIDALLVTGPDCIPPVMF